MQSDSMLSIALIVVPALGYVVRDKPSILRKELMGRHLLWSVLRIIAKITKNQILEFLKLKAWRKKIRVKDSMSFHYVKSSFVTLFGNEILLSSALKIVSIIDLVKFINPSSVHYFTLNFLNCHTSDMSCTSLG